MERRAKERLVGATIVVAVVVLVVPEFLTGPTPALRTREDPEGSAARTVTVDLSVPAAVPSAVEPPAAASALETAAASPISQAAEVPSAAAASVAPTSPATPSAPAPRVTGPAAPPEPAGAWAVQLGSFASAANAEKLSRQIRALGFTPYVSAAGAGAAERFRVRVGPMIDRAAAERTLEKLKAQGQTPSLVPPKP
jgi:DedD protein